MARFAGAAQSGVADEVNAALPATRKLTSAMESWTLMVKALRTTFSHQRPNEP